MSSLCEHDWPDLLQFTDLVLISEFLTGTIFLINALWQNFGLNSLTADVHFLSIKLHLWNDRICYKYLAGWQKL